MKVYINIHYSSGGQLDVNINENEGICSISYMGNLDPSEGLYSGGYSNDLKEVTLKEDENREIISLMKNIPITAFPEFAMGLDGTTISITIENGMNRASYRWWEEPPEEWAVLKRFVDHVVAVAGSELQII